MKKLSVIIPYHNGIQYIGYLLGDLAHQDFSKGDYEIIIVDDGSTQDAKALDSLIITWKDIDIQLIRQEQSGVSVARNRGIVHAKGEYLYFCDCDDRVRYQSLRQIYEIAGSKNLEVLFFNFITKSEGEELFAENYSDRLDSEVCRGVDYFVKFPKTRFHPFHYILSKKFVENSDLRFPEGVIYHEDEAFLLDVLLASRKVSYINNDVYFYISRPKEGARFYAGIQRAWKTANDRMWLLHKYRQILSDNPELPCRGVLRQRKGLVSFTLLSQAFRYCTLSQNRIILKLMKANGDYPFEEGRYINRPCHIAYKMMQMYPLWLTCCVIFHILPISIRKRF